MFTSDFILNAIKNTSYLEWAGFVTGIIYVILSTMRHILCWIFGLISSVIFVYLCFQAQLYIETGLQIFYVVMAVYGLIEWKKTGDKIVKVRYWNFVNHIWMIFAGIVLAAVLGIIFQTFTDQAYPFFDASIASFSLIATFLSAQRIIENWIYWIVVDFCAIFLYASRELVVSSGLYIVFTVMAIVGLIEWKKKPETKL